MSSAAHRSRGLALSCSSDYEFGVGREVDMLVRSGVTLCVDRQNHVDDTVRWENAGDQSPVGRDTTHFVTVDETVISPIQRTSLDRTPNTRTKYPVQSTANSKTFGSSGNDSKEEKLLEMYRGRREELLTEYERLIQMCDEACAATQKKNLS